MPDSDNDQKHPDGERPLEEVGPEECDATVAECEFAPGELDGEPADAQFAPDEELHEQFDFEPVAVVTDELDGLPRPADPHGDMPFAPPFTVRHVNCIEDTSEYVEVWQEELPEASFPAIGDEYGEDTAEGIFAGQRIPAPPVTPDRPLLWQIGPRSGSIRAEPGCFSLAARPHEPGTYVASRSQHDGEGRERERRKFDPSATKQLWGFTVVVSDDDDDETVTLVRPKRERCQFYKRQLFNIDGKDPDQPGGKVQFSNCTVRRSIGGAFMSLSGQAIFACDYRSPPDPESVEKHLDSRDRQRLADRAHRVLVPFAGFAGDDIHLDDQPAEGIFAGQALPPEEK